MQSADPLSTHRIMVNLRADQDQALRALAERKQHSLSAELRQAIAAWIHSEAQALQDEDPGGLAATTGVLGNHPTPATQQEEETTVTPTPRTREERHAGR
jgi:predicted transcriptional regulator